MSKNLNKKYELITTGGDVIFVGKLGSKNFIDRATGFNGDWATCDTAAYRAGFAVGKGETDKDFVRENFEALKKSARFVC